MQNDLLPFSPILPGAPTFLFSPTCVLATRSIPARQAIPYVLSSPRENTVSCMGRQCGSRVSRRTSVGGVSEDSPLVQQAGRVSRQVGGESPHLFPLQLHTYLRGSAPPPPWEGEPTPCIGSSPLEKSHHFSELWFPPL